MKLLKRTVTSIILLAVVLAAIFAGLMDPKGNSHNHETTHASRCGR